MDPISQFAVGGVFAAAFALPVTKFIRRAARQPERDYAPAIGASILCAGLAAMTPDLDILIRSDDYPLLALKFHRHFTHALVMSPLYALLGLPVAWFLFRRFFGGDLLRMWALMFLGIATHGVLDAMTNYGTHLMWPFTNERVSWNIISIIDPIFTLTLIAAMIGAALGKTLKPLRTAFVFMLIYWGAGVYQREAAEAVMLQLAESRGHAVVRHQVKPSFGNIVLWRAQYEADGRIYTDAINVLPMREPKVYEGVSAPLLVLDDIWLRQLPPRAQQDVRDFAFFSDYWITAVSTNGTEMIGDMRFATLPNAPGPMWAVITNQPLPNGHLPRTNLPRRQDGDWEKLWGMIVRE